MFSKKTTKFEKIFTGDLTLTTYCQIDGEDFVNFCGLLRKHELYIPHQKRFFGIFFLMMAWRQWLGRYSLLMKVVLRGSTKVPVMSVRLVPNVIVGGIYFVLRSWQNLPKPEWRWLPTDAPLTKWIHLWSFRFLDKTDDFLKIIIKIKLYLYLFSTLLFDSFT